MELKSFREILLKKAEENPYLQTLIKYAKDELIADEVIDSLLKMAEPSAAMGRGANHAVTSFAAGVKPVHVEQMRDALGHHISHYKGALKSMAGAKDEKDKAKLRGVADQHLNQIVPLMHLAGKASKHSGGNLTLDYPSTTPWETNYTTPERLPNGKLKEGTKDLGRRLKPNASREKNPRAVPDYRYLEMPPHPEHPSTGKIPHKGGYPFEEIQLGHPNKRDAGQAYLPIEDVGDVKDYQSHPFDMHPVHKLHDEPEHHLTPEQKDKYNADLAGWASSEHNKKWLEDQRAKHAKNPEAYKARGTKKPEPVFSNDVPLSQPAAPAAAAPVAEQPAPVPSNVVPIRKPAAAKAADMNIDVPPEGMEPSIAKHWKSFPESTRKEIIRDYLKGKK